jgi:hypothetical protein
MIMTLIGAVIPRLLLLVAWSNAPAFWESTLGSTALLAGGWLLLPTTTLAYGLLAPNGLTLLNWIWLGLALLIDLSTWGIGALAARKETSNFR